MTSLEEALEKVNSTCDWSHEEVYSVNHRNDVGDTPLHMAASWGDIEIIELFLANGADIEAEGENGDTPLHNAVYSRSIETVKYLISNGAQIKKSKSGSDPMDLAKSLGEMEIYNYFRERTYNKASKKADGGAAA